MMMYVVKYSGPFGYIKPCFSVRDELTYSQQFLTQSIVEGIEKKLFPEMLAKNGVIEKIVRYKLSYRTIDKQQEVTQTRGFNVVKKIASRPKSILTRGVMINPVIYLAFDNEEDAKKAYAQHICLCRNEDVLLPDDEILKMDNAQFGKLPGYELRFGESNQSFLVGYNRYDNKTPMYGWLEYNGQVENDEPI